MNRKVGGWAASRLSMLVLAGVCAAPLDASGQTATWLLNPGTNAFGTAANWSPATVPLGTATFGVSNTTTVDVSGGSTVGSFLFNSGASAYTFSSVNLSLNGAGIVNNSSRTQTFNIGAGAPTLGFTVHGAAPQRDAAILGLAANTAIAEAMSLYLRYDDEVGTGIDNHILSAGLRMMW